MFLILSPYHILGTCAVKVDSTDREAQAASLVLRVRTRHECLEDILREIT